MQLTKATKTLRVKPDGSTYAVAAGSSDVESSIIDTAGFLGCRIIVGFGTITGSAVTSVEVQQDTDSAGGTMADLLGTNVAVLDTDDNRIVIIDIYRPRERYLRAQIHRATANAVIDFMLVELYEPRLKPVTQDTATIVAAGVESHVSPAEGTA